MTTSIRWSLGALSVVLLLTATPAFAQRREAPLRREPLPAGQVVRDPTDPNFLQPPIQRPFQKKTAAREEVGRASLTDNQIATWLTLCNESEVRLGQFAAKKAHDKDVQQFAKKLADEHSQLAAQFRKFAPDAPQLTQANIGERSDRDARREGDKTAATERRSNSIVPGARTAAVDTQHGLPMKEICHQLAEKSLAAMEQELSHKDGSQFDHCFVGGQIFSHVNMLNTMQVLRPYASPELAKVIDEGIQGTQQHLAHVKKMAEQFAGEAKSTDNEKRTSDNKDD